MYFLTSNPDVGVTSDTHVGENSRVASKMELNTEKTSSQALLSCGNGEGKNTFIISYSVG